MQARLDAARELPGWVSGQFLKPADGAPKRVIAGTWRRQSDREAWHRSSTFQATRPRLNELEVGPGQQWWHEVTVAEQR